MPPAPTPQDSSPSIAPPPGTHPAVPHPRSIRFPVAWLLGLVVVDGTFLWSAERIQQPSWGGALLLIAAVINVPLFLGALLLLRAKF
ncbi:MAG: hypothetical protein WCK64_10700 [Synechococcaceae cyanobacterium ELA445]